MWDNPKLLGGLADVLFALSVSLMLYGAIHYAIHLPEFLPLNTVRLEKAVQRVSAEEMLRIAKNGVKGNLLTVDIENVKHALEGLPWVRGVSIRREFPDRLAVRLEEHQVLARWNSNMLVNNFGEVFSADFDRALPEFFGPEGTSVEIAAYFEYFSRELATVDLHMEKINLSPRHAWQLRLTNGVVLELGREDLEQRLARFVEVYPYTLAAEQDKFKYVDLRYRNGFAVGNQAKPLTNRLSLQSGKSLVMAQQS